jgi:hypothetical protein
MHAPNIGAPEYMQQILIDMKGDYNTIVGDSISQFQH